MKVFLNGRYRLVRDARVSALDRGLLYGDGLFETIRVVDGSPIALVGHLRRLHRSAKRIGLPFVFDPHAWQRRILALARMNGLDHGEAAARLTLTRGVGGDGLLPPPRARPTVLLTLRRVPAAVRRLRRQGVRVALLPFHPGLAGFLAGVKTTDYLTAMIGKQAARRRGCFEGLYTAPDGEVYEGTTSNLFLVRRGRLLTPPLTAGVLPGVTRAEVIRLARREGIEVRESRVDRRDLDSATEAFLTSSTLGILPIREFEDRKVPEPLPGHLTRSLQDRLEDSVQKDRLRGR